MSDKINMNPNVTSPLPKSLKLLPEDEAEQQLYDLDPRLKMDKPASEQSSLQAAGRKHLEEQKEIEDAAKEAGIETVGSKSTLDKVKDKLAELDNSSVEPEKASVSTESSEVPSSSSSASSEAPASSETVSADSSKPPSGESKEEDTSRANGSYKLRSIMDAYREMDKSTRDYLIVDTLSKFARGLGKDISNIGAAYTGGAIQDSTPEDTLWGARNTEMAKQGISSEANKVAGSDREQNYRGKEANIKAAELGNELTGYKLEIPRTYKQLIQSADKIEAPWLRAAVKGSAQAMLNNAVNGGELNATSLIANIVANGGNELAQAAQAAGKSPEQYVADTVKSMLPEIKTSIF